MALSVSRRAACLLQSLPLGAVRCQSGFGGDGGFGGPPQGGGFGGPPQGGGFGGPPSGGFGGPPQGGFGGPPQGGFGGPPQGGFGGPPQGGFGGPPQGGFGGPPQGGFGGPPQGGFGGNFQGGMAGATFRPRRREVAPIPDSPPFGLHLSRVAGLSETELRELFAACNPTDIKLQGEMTAFMYFDNREDLVAALDLSGKEEIRFIRVTTSLRLKRISEIGDDPPFRAHMRNLPPGMRQEDILELFKDFSPISCVVIQNRLTMVPYAFVEFSSKENLLKALDTTMSSEVRGISVNPAHSRARDEGQ